jgi:hypothetical protein
MLEMVLVLVNGGVIFAAEIFVLFPLRMFSRKHSRVGSDLGIEQVRGGWFCCTSQSHISHFKIFETTQLS